MDARDLINEVRAGYVADATISPTRPILYTRASDSSVTPLNSYIGMGVFSKSERETLGRFECFGGLLLEFSPAVTDSVEYNGIVWKVVRWTQLGQLYTVFCENKRHNGRPQQ